MSSPFVSYGALLSLRLAYFLGCRRFVHRSLFNLHDDAGLSGGTSARNGEDGGSGASSPGIDTTKSSGRGWPWEGWRKGDWDVLPLRRPSTSSTRTLLGQHERPKTNYSTATYSRGAAFVFCWAFCEGSLLFSLVLLGGVLDPQARQWSWTLSLGLLIGLVVFIAPLAECLLLSFSLFRSASYERPRILSLRTFILTLLPFCFYLFLFYRVGLSAQSLLGVESGSHQFGFFNMTLARICVPGVFLIAGLSGGGAVNTAWETWEWRRQERQAPITEHHIAFADQALQRARVDLDARRAEMDDLNRRGDSPSGGVWMFTGSGGSKVSQLKMEIVGLEAMECQMERDLATMRKRKAGHEYGRTLAGSILNVANWIFSFYCIYRVFMSCVNLIFGYWKRLPSEPSNSSSTYSTTDLATSLLARFLKSVFAVEVDLAIVSRLVGLVLLGGIIVVNMRAVLAWGSRLFKATSAGLSASFMLLALAQLMAIYLLTCLISLPSAHADSASSSHPSDSENLLATLPSFQVFTRLFDGVFLLAAGSTFAVRWLGRQLAAEEGGGFGGDWDAGSRLDRGGEGV